MNKKLRLAIIILLALTIVSLVVWNISRGNVAVLNPAGLIASQQRTLILVATGLSLLVIIPVFILTGFIAYKYRATNTKAKYTPDWDHSRAAETTWWAIPIVLILILSVITYQSSHNLDPFKPLASTKTPITVQVIALQWKWLFIYPDQHIASLNHLEIPVGTPINFQITSDAPMNSFWIPRLGGQVYAMSGMSTQLHLVADQEGTFQGSSANLSGQGFSGMTFTTHASTEASFNNWMSQARRASTELTLDQYHTLAHPSQNNPVTLYRNPMPGLYDEVVMSYMMPSGSHLPTESETP